MSLPSYRLSNEGGTWICSGEMPGTGKPFRFDVGAGSRDRAEGAAEAKLRSKMASAAGSKARWERWRARKRAVGGDGAVTPGPPPPADSPRRPSAPSADELRAKLLGLGDAAPDVLPPRDGRAGAAADSAPADDMDGEGGELIASLLAKGATLGIVWLANRPLAKRKPPMQGEPHEKGLEWFHDGMEHHLKTLLGRTATLGPTGKILAGAAIIVGSVWMTAEPIPGAGRSAAPEPAPAPSPSPAPAPAAAPPTEAEAPTTSLARTNGASPLGVFGVAQTKGGH